MRGANPRLRPDLTPDVHEDRLARAAPRRARRLPLSGAEAPRSTAPPRDRLVAEGATLVDVRTPEEFASGHLEGARNIPVDQIAERAAELPRAKTVTARPGSRSAMAAATLARAGFTVRDL